MTINPNDMKPFLDAVGVVIKEQANRLDDRIDKLDQDLLVKGLINGRLEANLRAIQRHCSDLANQRSKVLTGKAADLPDALRKAVE